MSSNPAQVHSILAEEEEEDRGISKIPVPRQKYIPGPKAKLLDGVVSNLFKDSNGEDDDELQSFLLLSPCLDSILHAEHMGNSGGRSMSWMDSVSMELFEEGFEVAEQLVEDEETWVAGDDGVGLGPDLEKCLTKPQTFFRSMCA